MKKFLNWLINSSAKSSEEVSAEKAWMESSYGRGSYVPIEERIKRKQKFIRNSIRSKCYYESGTPAQMYRCVVDIEEDLRHNVDEILQPFRDGGFNVIDLSAIIPELKEENVFLISWKHVFDRRKGCK